jgi:hypothetical protein
MAKKSAPRTCQPCTACCDGWLRMEIGGVEVFPGSPCPHSTGSGCDDYANRPESCVKFNCGWIIPNSPLPEWFKPSNAKVVVIFNKLQWQGVPVDLAVPVGKRIPPRALDWLKQFAEQHRRPLIYAEQIMENGRFQKQQTFFAHGPAAFRDQVAAWQAQGRPLW